MARITVEDCVIKIPNRFELVLMASQRAREISAGAPLTIDRDNDKNPVVALREIAEETVDHGKLYESLVVSLQKHAETDEPEEDELDLLTAEENLSGLAVDTGAAPVAGVAEPMAEEKIAKEMVAAEEAEGAFKDLAKEFLAEETESLTAEDEGADKGNDEGADKGEDKGADEGEDEGADEGADEGEDKGNDEGEDKGEV